MADYGGKPYFVPRHEKEGIVINFFFQIGSCAPIARCAADIIVDVSYNPRNATEIQKRKGRSFFTLIFDWLIINRFHFIRLQIVLLFTVPG